MKNIYFILAVSLFLASCGPTTVIESDSYRPAPAPVESVSYQSFYDQLSPYGSWISYPGYGYVWMPNAGPDFKPYATNGNWIYTDAGWTWSSNYNWGWAPFHYGRWFYENGYGWMWMPGNEWAPAWVSWRSGGDYYGWAPLGPKVSVDIALNSYEPPSHYWSFVPNRYMGNPGWHNYYVNENQNITIIHQTTIINNYSGSDRQRYSYAPGPDVHEVNRVSGSQFTAVHIRETNTPEERVSGGQYVVYHPQVNAGPAARGDAQGRPAATPAPTHYQSFSDLHPANNQPRNYNQQENNGRQMPENPNNNQPVYNPRTGSNNNPNGNQPANPNQPYAQHPNNPNGNPPAYPNQPYTQRPSNPPPNTPATPAETPAGNRNHNGNNPVYGSANVNAAQNPGHVNSGTPSQEQNLHSAQSGISTNNAQKTANNNVPKPTSANPQQNKPTPPHNPNNNGQPKPANTDKKPDPKTEDKPKNKDGGNNN